MDAATEVGAYDAKTHLPDLLRKVQGGMRFTITHRGRPVAELVPAESSARQGAGLAALRMQEFMRNRPPIRGVDVKALIEEGRD
jgi:prevent-host-death family protein